MTGNSANGRHAVIVGAGAVGTASAHFLNQDGWRVTVLDQAAAPSGCSYGNCGYITPSHVLPLAVPGAVRRTLAEMLHRGAAVKIRPGLSLDRWRWLIRFARRCNEQAMHESAAGIHQLLNVSRRLYSDIVRTEQLDCQFNERGLMMVFQTERGFEAYGRVNDLLASQYDTPAQRLSSEEACAIEPALKPSVAGAWHYLQDAHMRPDQLMQSWHANLQRRGVQFQFGTSVSEVHDAEGGGIEVRTERGAPIRADVAVVATGALTPRLESIVGVRLPIQPGKGYSITFAAPGCAPLHPILLPEAHVGITPWKDGFRLGSMMEIVGYDTSISEPRLDVLRRAADRVLHCQLDYAEPRRWFGWRPMTPDSRPFIDYSPRSRKILVAAGHNMLGMSMAPASGQLVADLAADRQPSIDRKYYRIDRRI